MSENFSSEQPLGPLSVGNVISASIRIYRDYFKSYFGISLKVTGWSLIPLLLLLVVGIVVSVMFAGAFEGSGNLDGVGPAVGVILLSIIVVIIVYFYCASKALANAALISRLTYGLLTNKPEIPKEAGRQIYPYAGRFLRAQILVGLTLFVINFGLSIVQAIIGGAFNLILRNSVSFGVLQTFSLILSLVSSIIYLWFALHYLIPELPIAVESNIKYSDAVKRSWDLSHGFVFKIGLIFTAAFFITLPIFALSFIPLLGIIPALASFAETATLGVPPSPEFFITLASSFLGVVTLFLILNIVMLPFWQTLKAVVYYDLRNRKEGLDLNLRSAE